MSEFASAGYTAGQLNAIIKILKKQAGEDGPDRFLRGELTVSEPTRSWREEDGVIYFSVTSDGTTGESWIKRTEGNSFRVGDCAKSVLLSPGFKPTNGVTTEVAVLKGALFTDNERVTSNIRAKAYAGAFTKGRKLSDPNAEITCLIREKFSDEEIKAMGLWYIVAMHKPINDSDGDPSLLDAYRDGDGRWLSTSYGSSLYRWDREGGFAFSVSQVGL